ncbi:MAG: tetratricopeptide repeat protein [Spirochaetales bacterium]
MKYSSRNTKATTGRPGRWLSRAITIVVVIVAVTIVGLVASGVWTDFPFGVSREDGELADLWRAGSYELVVDQAQTLLDEAPYHPQALTFGGFGHFYVGVDALTREQQVHHLDRSIALLRKAIHVSRAPLERERYYVLAKAYYHKGETYMDQSVRYMQRSIKEGYEAIDSRSYLGLSYASLGKHEESVKWFADAITYAESNGDLGDAHAIRIKAAESFAAMEDYEAAADQLRTAIARLEDRFLELMARNQLVSVLVRARAYEAAERVAEETVEQFPESADAHYYLGVVYSRTERTVEARDQWRTARRIDPAHTGALESLAGREF